MSLTLNKGEWSEMYVFLRALAEGKLFPADDRLNRIGTLFLPILKIIREETAGSSYEYRTNAGKGEIAIFLNGTPLLRLPGGVFEAEADRLLAEINRRHSRKATFEVADTEAFIRSIYVNKPKARSSDKTDIAVQLHDPYTGYERIVGFSIKSDLGSPPTLLNASGATNFVFLAEGLDKGRIPAINAIESAGKLKDRVRAVYGAGARLVYRGVQSSSFEHNLRMIDSQMPTVAAQMLIGYFSGRASGCRELADYVGGINPLGVTGEFYRHKIKELLSAAALGMKPATRWNGTDEATGGYIIVKTTGELMTYYLYNRDSFREYLLNNTRADSPGSDKHGYGKLYEENGEVFIKLNLQIRFV